MSLLSWLFKSKKEMSKPNTKWVKVGKYKISSHAQNRIVVEKRKLKKKDMVTNLLGRSKNSKLYLHNDGKTYQYDRVNEKNRTVTHITANNNVKTIRKFREKDKNKQYKNF